MQTFSDDKNTIYFFISICCFAFVKHHLIKFTTVKKINQAILINDLKKKNCHYIFNCVTVSQYFGVTSGYLTAVKLIKEKKTLQISLII